MSKAELQRITISGRHWGDIIGLPCFKALYRYDSGFSVRLTVSYVDGRQADRGGRYIVMVHAGDVIIEYENHKWGIEYAKERP